VAIPEDFNLAGVRLRRFRYKVVGPIFEISPAYCAFWSAFLDGPRLGGGNNELR